MSSPDTPSSKVITEYLQSWKTLENYTLQEKSLGLLFHDLCPKNEKIEDVLLKVSTLNDFYSTNIYDTYSVAKHIISCKVDLSLDKNDIDLVNTIAPVTINGKTRKFYSFASKYCSHHKPEVYPIYDSYVEKMLMYFNKKDKFDNFKKEDLKEYSRFIAVIEKFKEHYKLSKFTLRDIDIYLWLAGKKHFPNNYKKHNKAKQAGTS